VKAKGEKIISQNSIWLSVFDVQAEFDEHADSTLDYIQFIHFVK
jgi:hypothetical protein